MLSYQRFLTALFFVLLLLGEAKSVIRDDDVKLIRENEGGGIRGGGSNKSVFSNITARTEYHDEHNEKLSMLTGIRGGGNITVRREYHDEHDELFMLPGIINDDDLKRLQMRMEKRNNNNRRVLNNEQNNNEIIINFLGGYTIDTSNYIPDLDTCYSSDRQLVYLLESPLECQIYCTLLDDCYTFAYRHDVWHNRCHLCSHTNPTTNFAIDCTEPDDGEEFCSHYGERLDVSRSQFVRDLINGMKPIFNNPSSYSQEQLDQVELTLEFIRDLIDDKQFDDNPSLLNELDDTLMEYALRISPTPSTPVEHGFEQQLLTYEANKLLKIPANEVTAHRTAFDVYGTISTNVPRVTVTTTLDTTKGRWHPTGAYAVPGELVVMKVPSNLIGYRIRINAHDDDISPRSSWVRLPIVHRYYDITSTTMRVASAFGGPIFIDFGLKEDPVGADFDEPAPNLGQVNIECRNVVEHPYFKLSKHTNSDWINGMRDKPVPYAVFESEKLIIVQKSSNSITLDDPTGLMEWWDSVVELEDDLAGRRTRRTSPDLVNIDVQISHGAAHAGYPIQALEERWLNLADYESLLEDGDWGTFHEIGHNHQRRLWTFDGNPKDNEVTVNIFTVYCFVNLVPRSSDSKTWTVDPIEVMDMAKVAIDSSGGDYAQVDDVILRLTFWLQLAYGFGWDKMKEVLTSYETNPPSSSDLSELEKRDEWFVRYSQATGYDLTKFMMDTWGLTVSSGARNQVYNLPSWMPIVGGISGTFDIDQDSTKTFDLVDELHSLDDIIEISSITQGSHGSVTEVSPAGSYKYTPSAGFVGSDTFDYTARSSAGNTVTFQIRMNVVGSASGQTTPAPTKRPTPSPTKRPTPSPTKRPTPSPTTRPTPSPTTRITPSPTKRPTPSPTKRPTPSPTKRPTPSPTKRPTPSPTKRPTPSPTNRPTPSPTNRPTPSPTVPTQTTDGSSCPGAGESKLKVSLLTDNYGHEVWWELVAVIDVSNGGGSSSSIISSGGFNYLTSNGEFLDDNTLYEIETCITTRNCYKLTISDIYGDGICCNYGDGSFQVYLGDNLIKKGGEFGLNEEIEIGDCSII